MKKKQLLLKSFVASAMMTCFSFAAMGQAASVPTIDGDLGDAAWATATTFDIKHVINDDNITGSSDLSGTVKVLWTADSVYVAIDVKDDSLYGLDAAGYPNDNVCVYLDLFNKKTATYADSTQLYWEASWYNDNVAGRVGAAGNIWRNPDPLANIKKIITNKVGYTMEIASAWSNLSSGYTAATDMLIGFDIKLSDNDGSVTSGSQRNQLAWNDITDNGWQYPNVWGTIKLASDGSVSAVAPVSATIDGNLDDFWTLAAPQKITSVIDTANATTAADLSGELRVRWDADSFYYFVDVKDDSLYGLDAAGYPNDNICIYLDLFNKKTATYVDSTQLYWEASWYNDNIAGRVGAAGNIWRNPDPTANVKKIINNKVNYTMEIAAAWKNLSSGFTPEVGDTIGFDTKLSDNDGSVTSGSQRSQIAWNDISDNGWQYPIVFGSIKLQEGGFVKYLSSRPAATSSVTATIVDSIVTVTWKKVTAATGYNVYKNGKKIGSTTTELTLNDTLSASIANVVYIVRAEVSGVESNYRKSAAISYTKPTAVNSVSGVVASVFPNPASDMVKITSTNGISSVRLMDLSGREVYRISSANASSVNMSLSSVKAGLYIIAIQGSNGAIATQKLLVK